METKDISTISRDATVDFERDLNELILAAFGRGADVEGKWTVDVPISSAPNWTITIEKRGDDIEPTFEPTLLDE